MAGKKKETTHKKQNTHRDGGKPSWVDAGRYFLLKRFGKGPWVRRKRRCPKCGSNKWEKRNTSHEFLRNFFMFDPMYVLVMGGNENRPFLIDYRCKKCGEEFSFWEYNAWFSSHNSTEKRCNRCRSKNLKIVFECEYGNLYECLHCGALPVIIFKEKEEKEKKRG